MIDAPSLLRAVATAEPAEIPTLIGTLATALAASWARLSPAERPAAPSTQAPLTAAEVAERLNVPKSCVYEWARQGRVPALKLGRYRRFDWRAVEEAVGKGLEVQESQTRNRNRPPRKPHKIGQVQTPDNAATALLPERKEDNPHASR